MRLHTRTIIRDRRHVFVGSQSLRAAELDSRREVGLIVQDAKAVKQLVDIFESDWARKSTKHLPVPPDDVDAAAQGTSAKKEVANAVAVFTKELQPLASRVKKAVKQAVVKAGKDVLHNHDVKDTMKKVVKKAVKAAVKDAVHEAQESLPKAVA
jgi:phosphatidylserine/phosphatidylglycerophosphate/cardiolipin synthase-like enzyme